MSLTDTQKSKVTEIITDYQNKLRSIVKTHKQKIRQLITDRDIQKVNTIKQKIQAE